MERLLLSLALVQAVFGFELVEVDSFTSSAIQYSVESRFFSESPNELLITSRKSGLVAYHVDGKMMKQEIQWNASASVEGIDRVGSTLVVVDIQSSGLWIWHLTAPSFAENTAAPIFVRVSPAGALHVRLRGEDGIAFISTGFNTTQDNWSVVAIDTNVHRMVGRVFFQVVDGCGCPEGVFLGRKGMLYMGGYCGAALVTVDAKDPTNMKIVDSLHDHHFVQMVSAAVPDGVAWQPPYTLYSALWGLVEGGLAEFNLSDPAHPSLSRMVLDPSMPRANRVHLTKGNEYAFLPIELMPGRIAVIRLDTMSIETVVDIDAKAVVYTLAIHGDFVYALGANSYTMHIFRIEYG